MSILSVLILLNFGMDMNSFELYFGFDSSSSSMIDEYVLFLPVTWSLYGSNGMRST